MRPPTSRCRSSRPPQPRRRHSAFPFPEPRGLAHGPPGSFRLKVLWWKARVSELLSEAEAGFDDAVASTGIPMSSVHATHSDFNAAVCDLPR